MPICLSPCPWACPQNTAFHHAQGNQAKRNFKGGCCGAVCRCAGAKMAQCVFTNDCKRVMDWEPWQFGIGLFFFGWWWWMQFCGLLGWRLDVWYHIQSIHIQIIKGSVVKAVRTTVDIHVRKMLNGRHHSTSITNLRSLLRTCVIITQEMLHVLKGRVQGQFFVRGSATVQVEIRRQVGIVVLFMWLFFGGNGCNWSSVHVSKNWAHEYIFLLSRADRSVGANCRSSYRGSCLGLCLACTGTSFPFFFARVALQRGQSISPI